MKELEEYNLEEIILLNDKELYETYLKEVELLRKTPLGKEITEKMYGYSLIDIYKKIQQEEEKIRSYLFFPNQLIKFYPSKKENHAKNSLTCDFSGSIIKKGSLYISYRPLLINISTSEKYVLKRTIKVESGYCYDLPENIQELENLYENMKAEENANDGIDYSHFNQRMGGQILLQKLQRK